MTTSSIPSIGMISLGCPKAGSDTERILTQLRAEGYLISNDYAKSDLILINTCGFIDSAEQESLSAIGEAIQKNGKVIVTGCLGTKKDLIKKTHPQVLAITGPQDFAEVFAQVHQHLPKPEIAFHDLIPPQGLRLTPSHYAYLKISEGCNHRCSFCIIPHLRGNLVSRSIDDVLTEAQHLVNAGVRELLVISQDTSAYGVDLKYRTGFWQGRPIKTNLTHLAKALAEFDIWIRFHYVYPYPHVDEIIPLMAEGMILPYIDVPLQHASPRILKLMKRPANTENNLKRIEAWREICPEITIRSTFIVGFPGETEEDFEQLLDFMEIAQLDHVGCFTYSAVEGASANNLSAAIPEPLKQERYERFMALQKKISYQKLQKKIGEPHTVLVDKIIKKRNKSVIAVGRTASFAPEIDGNVYLKNADGLVPGDLVDVKITAVDQYDLWAEPPDPHF